MAVSQMSMQSSQRDSQIAYARHPFGFPLWARTGPQLVGIASEVIQSTQIPPLPRKPLPRPWINLRMRVPRDIRPTSLGRIDLLPKRLVVVTRHYRSRPVRHQPHAPQHVRVHKLQAVRRGLRPTSRRRRRTRSGCRCRRGGRDRGAARPREAAPVPHRHGAGGARHPGIARRTSGPFLTDFRQAANALLTLRHASA